MTLLDCLSERLCTPMQRGWTIENGRVLFNTEEEEETAQVTALNVINNSLTYARELERIV